MEDEERRRRRWAAELKKGKEKECEGKRTLESGESRSMVREIRDTSLNHNAEQHQL